MVVTMNDGVTLIFEVDKSHIEKRIETGYLDEWANGLDVAIEHPKEALKTGAPKVNCRIGERF